MKERWWIWECGPARPAENMAWDEMLMLIAGELARPILRFYAWDRPAATFGYFQRFTVVEAQTGLRPLIRRPTAGGLVPHSNDWTYTLVVPPSHPRFSLRAAQGYRELHEWIRQAFARLQIIVHLAPAPRGPRGNACFVGAEQYDLMRSNQKIAGAAQRRARSGLLIQGSIQHVSSWADRGRWQRAMRRVAEDTWGVDWAPWHPRATHRDLAEHLERHKYGERAYNERKALEHNPPKNPLP